MRADLLDLDFEIDEDIFLATVIGSLPAEYSGLLQSWELAADGKKTKSNLIASLLNRGADLNVNPRESKNEHVLVARTRPRLTREEIKERKKTTRCGYCKEVGH